MALENTVLTEESIAQLLAQHYGIRLVSMQKLKLGSANCYRIYDGNQYYFLKEFQSSFSEKAVIQEAKLLEFLQKTDVPTAQFYKTIDQEYVIRCKDHLVCLEEYVEGQAYDYDDLPEALLPAVGSMLGKLHRALKDYPLPVDMAETWLSSFSAETTIKQYEALMEAAESKADDENCARILADLQYKKQLAERCESYKQYYNGITYCSTHGDYQGCQLIFEQDAIKAVIDFSSASCLPAVWEIMRSFVQSSGRCRNSAVIDIAALCEYVREYMKFSPLTAADMAAMPYVYLFQLARSKYGYPQYLNSESEDKDGLLQFAHWRTQMCREVEKKAEQIAGELMKLIESKENVRLHKPDYEELIFRQQLLADEPTMSYNANWGGTIDWPREKWTAWAKKWLDSDESQYFYRYIQSENGLNVGEAALRYDENYGMHVVSVIVKYEYRGKGYGRRALELLMEEAERMGIACLCDDIALDNPSIHLFEHMGFNELWRNDQIVMLAKELTREE